MSDVHEKLAALKALYPADAERIEQDGARVSDLLKRQEYANLEATQELMALCRRDIVFARMRLSSDRTLSPEVRDALWHTIESREWFLKMVGRNFEAELEAIQRDLEAELQR
jgi:hypothetical protein